MLRSSRATRSRVAGSTTCAPRSTPCCGRRRRPRTSTGHGSGSIACSRHVARGRSSPARSWAERSPSATCSRSVAPEPGYGCAASRRPTGTPSAAAPGTRVALNLTGVERSALARGDALVRPGQWTATTVVDVAVTPRTRGAAPRPGAPPGLRRVGRARGVVPDARRRTARFARLRFATPIPLAPGDRVVLRDAGRECTVAGAEVLDVEPSGATRDAAARLALPIEARLLAGSGRVLVADVPRLTGLSDAAADALAAAMVDSGLAVLAGDSLVDASCADRAARARSRARARDAPASTSRPWRARLDVDTGDLRVMLEGDEQLVVERGIVRDAAQVPIDASPEADRARRRARRVALLAAGPRVRRGRPRARPRARPPRRARRHRRRRLHRVGRRPRARTRARAPDDRTTRSPSATRATCSAARASTSSRSSSTSTERA